jgi:acetyl-CoA synthetase
VSYRLEDFHIRWYEDGELNASVNCLDRHLEQRGDKTALIFEHDDPSKPADHITYRELHARVCKLANALRSLGVRKGDRVTIYLPMIPEAVVAMLACARVGAIHSVVFGGFAPQSIADRVADCTSKLIITSDEGLRGGKRIGLKANVDAALRMPGTNTVETVLVVRHTGAAVDMQMPRDRWYDAVVDSQPTQCEPERMNAEDPLFILYTSGSTGKPKGVLHTTGGYLAYASYTHEVVFDIREDDIYWCTADVGWVTGHSYIVYGPLANGSTAVVFEGVPNYPNVSRFWGRDRPPPGDRFLHRADRDPCTDARRRRAGAAHLAQVAAPARHGRRADQSGSLALVLRGGRRQPLPDRRHVVADRDRRHPDHSAGRRDRSQARLGHQAVLRRAAGAGRCQRRAARRRSRGQPGTARLLARSDAHRLRRPPAFHRHLLQDLSGHVLHRRRLPPRCRRLLLDHRSRRRRHQRQRPPHRHGGRWKVRWFRIPRSPKRRWSASRTTSRARASTPTSP